MNKYNIGDTVYYVSTGVMRKGTVEKIERGHPKDTIVKYTVSPNYEDNPTLYGHMIHPTVDALIEWLKTTVK